MAYKELDVRYVTAGGDDTLTLLEAVPADLGRCARAVGSTMPLLFTKAASASELTSDSGVSAFGLRVTGALLAKAWNI